MPFDEELVHRLREQLADDIERVTEKRMFGGWCFLVDGYMTVNASRTGGLMARVDPKESAALLDPPTVTRMVMRNREMEGWLLVAPEGVASDADLAAWVRRAIAYVETLPQRD